MKTLKIYIKNIFITLICSFGIFLVIAFYGLEIIFSIILKPLIYLKQKFTKQKYTKQKFTKQKYIKQYNKNWNQQV